jgi:DNA polymerase-3 subunit gamma/tau
MIFDDVVGQSHVTNTLRNAIATDRIAHAYIFSGTRGCGKTTTARILARALNCISPINNNPDNTCDMCTEIIKGSGMDVIEIDGASNRGVDEIRNLRDSVRYTPTHGKFKIYIIDEVHMLTKEAFNALLKTLEEPPEHVVFVFATTEVHKVPMTILSRCQRFDFRRISVEEIISKLIEIAKAENVTINKEALMIIAKRADGSMRDAQSIFDQVRSFCGDTIKADELLKAFNIVNQETYFRITDLFKKHDSRAAIQLVDEVLRSGFDLREFIGGLTEHLRNILIVRSTGSTQLIDASEHHKEMYEKETSSFSEQDLLRYIKQNNELEQELRWAAQPRYRLEAGLLQMVMMQSSVQINHILQQIDGLKKELNNNFSKEKSTSNFLQSTRDNNSISTEVKVIGEVGASYLKSSAASTYAQLAGMDLAKFAGVSRLDEPKHRIQYVREPSNVVYTISGDEIQEKWSEFVNGVSKMRIAVGITLKDAHILDINNGLVRIACSDEYNVSTLQRNKEFLSDAFHKIIGKRVAIETVLDSSARPLVKTAYRAQTSMAISDEEQSSEIQKEILTNDEHPIITFLKRELDAEKIEQA